MLSALPKINTLASLDQVLVIATDIAYLFLDPQLEACCFLAVLLSHGKDILCFKYIRCHPADDLQEDESNQPPEWIDYQLLVSRIWEILNDLEFGEKLKGGNIVPRELKGKFPGLDYLEFERSFVHVLLYLKLKADMISLRAFSAVEVSLESRSNYDVKEVVKSPIIESETAEEAVRKKFLVAETTSSEEYEGMIVGRMISTGDRNIYLWA